MFAFVLVRPFLVRLFTMVWRLAEELVGATASHIIQGFPILYSNTRVTLLTKEKIQSSTYKSLDTSLKITNMR